MKKNSYITVTDQFCGAGGSSQGVRALSRSMGGGLEVKLALNHWKLAIETHNTNFPDTLHDCTDISACDPRRYPKTNILITSPECTNHSLAKGKKRKNSIDLFTHIDPAEERSRATMWDVPRFAEYHDYEIIIVENVVDARHWVMWDAWLKAMHCLGYMHECVYFNSMHAHPTPQSRDRIYVVFWKKGNKAPDLALRPLAWCLHCNKQTETYQSFKKADVNWGKYKQQYVYRCPTCNNTVEPYYYAAFNCIDWSIPGTRIGDRKKPLSENTLKRIAFGMEKYWNEPQIISTRYTSGVGSRVKAANGSPLPTIPGDVSHAIFNPIVINVLNSQKRNNLNNVVRGTMDKALSTQTTMPGLHLLSPFILNSEYNSKDKVRSATDQQLFTQTTRATNSIVMPFIVENKGTSKSRSINDRLGCITGASYHALLSHESFRAFLTYNYNGLGVSDIKAPVNTIPTKDRVSLITPGTVPKIEDCYYRMLLPHEVKLGMAFDHDYIVLGNNKDQVKQLGNAVTPPVMKQILERCIETLK